MTDSPVNQYYNLDPYMDFVQSEGIPVIEGYEADCLNIQLEPWERLGGLGAYVHLRGKGDYLSMYVAGIPAGGYLHSERHLHDELIYVLKGHGATVVELSDGEKHSFEWGPGSLFGIPLNAEHQHFNGSGSEAVRFAAVTNLAIIMNLFHNKQLIYDNHLSFSLRPTETKYFRGEGEFRQVKPGRHQWETNFVSDLTEFSLYEWKARGAGGKSVQFTLADSTMHSHISEYPVGTYKKAHRHDAGFHIFCVTGRGYTLMWKEGQDPLNTIRINWQPGLVYAPPDDLFHQHFNTANQPSRYLALGFGGVRYPVLLRAKRNYEGMDQSVKEGGFQIEYEDEDPRIRQLFKEELAKYGIEPRMPTVK